jgi:hypothetical protein
MAFLFCSWEIFGKKRAVILRIHFGDEKIRVGR